MSEKDIVLKKYNGKKMQNYKLYKSSKDKDYFDDDYIALVKRLEGITINQENYKSLASRIIPIVNHFGEDFSMVSNYRAPKDWYKRGLIEYIHDRKDSFYSLYLSAKGDYSPALCILGTNEINTHNDYQEAFKFYMKAVQLDEKNGRDFSDHGITNEEEALEWYNQLQKTNIKEENRLNTNNYYMELADYLYDEYSEEDDYLDLKDTIKLNHMVENLERQSKDGYNQAQIALKYGDKIFANEHLTEMNLGEIAEGLDADDYITQLKFAQLYKMAEQGNRDAKFMIAEYNALFGERFVCSFLSDSYAKARKYIGKSIVGEYKTPECRAFDSYLDLAEKGDFISQYLVAFYYYDGRIVDKDINEAYRWYKLANDEDQNSSLRNVLSRYDNSYRDIEGLDRIPRLNAQNMGFEAMNKINKFLKDKKMEERKNLLEEEKNK